MIIILEIVIHYQKKIVRRLNLLLKEDLNKKTRLCIAEVIGLSLSINSICYLTKKNNKKMI